MYDLIKDNPSSKEKKIIKGLLTLISSSRIAKQFKEENR